MAVKHATIAGEVEKQLRKIARRGMPQNWMGFDDADIQWFLDEHWTRKGLALDELRLAYDLAMDEMARHHGCRDGGVVLFSFVISQQQARDILKEIRSDA